MRVSVYKDDEGRMDVLVQASPGMGRPPVLLQDVTPADVVRRVLPVVVGMRGRKLPGEPHIKA